MNHITALDEPFPGPASLAQATTTHTKGRFRISARKLPISKAGPIDAMTARLGIPVPEMIFGDNLVRVQHVPSGWTISFCAEDALDRVDKTGERMLQVAYAGEWSSSRERSSAAGIREVVRPYDWSYSTDYRGTVSVERATNGIGNHESGESEAGQEQGEGSGSPEAPASSTAEIPTLKPTTQQIPLELLKRRDPILFFEEVMLYESELDDNGISVLSVKVRVMEHRMLLLCRLFMRLDDVVVRMRDTRVYVDFDTDLVIREYTAKEDRFENVKRGLMMTGLLPDAVLVAMRDSNQVANLLPVVEHELECVSLAQSG